MKKQQVELPRVAASQAHEGEAIAKENLQKGDLFFCTFRKRKNFSRRNC
jgi:lipoprotein Spr